MSEPGIPATIECPYCHEPQDYPEALFPERAPENPENADAAREYCPACERHFIIVRRVTFEALQMEECETDSDMFKKSWLVEED